MDFKNLTYCLFCEKDFLETAYSGRSIGHTFFSCEDNTHGSVLTEYKFSLYNIKYYYSYHFQTKELCFFNTVTSMDVIGIDKTNIQEVVLFLKNDNIF